MIMLSFIFFSNALINGYKTHFIRKTRASVSAIMHKLGIKSKNYYRMSDASCWKLHNNLIDNIDKKEHNVSRRSRKKLKHNFIPNGLIFSLARLSSSLRVFARGALDIALVHSVSPTKLHCSTLRVVDAIRLDKSMNIKFPASCEKQRSTANDFKIISTAEFDNCAGYTDRLLIWIFKPNERDTMVSEVGIKKNTVGDSKVCAIQKIDSLM